ncbi:MAG: hypothetical protein ACRDT6_04485 [Micromonosporaceae bacterium]
MTVPAPFVGSPAPPPIPPGYGCLVVTFDRGPYLYPVMYTGRFHVGPVRVPVGEGTWYVIVPPGVHEMKVKDPLGITLASTRRTVAPGRPHPLRFGFGAWRNRVYDERGTDVTTFGLWSSYTTGLVVSAAGLALAGLCAGGYALIDSIA